MDKTKMLSLKNVINYPLNTAKHWAMLLSASMYFKDLNIVYLTSFLNIENLEI